MKKLLGVATFLVLAVNANASEKYEPGADNKAVAKGVASMSVAWIKDKGKKYDLNMTLHNENSEKGIIVFLNDIGCQRGSLAGQLKHTFFNTGERTIDFKPGQSKSFNMVCNLGGKATGEFQLSVSKIYDNPSMDGKTVGKVIAKDMVWKQDDRKE